MQLDTTQKGLAAIFKRWKVPLVEELHTGRDMSSGQAYKFLQEHARDMDDADLKRSRASVIFFLNDLADLDLLEYEEKTGKGGYHKVYTMTLTRTEFAHKITGWFVAKLLEAFPDEAKTFMWPRHPEAEKLYPIR